MLESDGIDMFQTRLEPCKPCATARSDRELKLLHLDDVHFGSVQFSG